MRKQVIKGVNRKHISADTKIVSQIFNTDYRFLCPFYSQHAKIKLITPRDILPFSQ
jgi:hypothetical protein